MFSERELQEHGFEQGATSSLQLTHVQQRASSHTILGGAFLFLIWHPLTSPQAPTALPLEGAASVIRVLPPQHAPLSPPPLPRPSLPPSSQVLIAHMIEIKYNNKKMTHNKRDVVDTRTGAMFKFKAYKHLSPGLRKVGLT